ncbi:MAG: DUF134 domain-containing protein, partial [bacterium]|nr:DUF134 domain-containing protein [bacterium]
MGRSVKKSVGGSYADLKSFKPANVPLLDVEEIELTTVELESIRLADVLGLSYDEAGREMGVSRATFGRIVRKTRKSIADALVNSKAITIKQSKHATGRRKPSQKKTVPGKSPK